jgi:hypothetical protein
MIGAEDSGYFAAQKNGFVEPISPDRLRAEILRNNRFGDQEFNIGQVETATELILTKGEVKDAFSRNKSYFHGPYAEAFHPEFRGLMGAIPG